MKRDDDLFQESTMSFGEHLEELRTCLIRALVGVVVCFLIGLYFAEDVVKLIQEPFQDALVEYYKNESIKKYNAWLAEQQAQGLVVPEDPDLVEYMVRVRGLLPHPVHFQPRDMLAALKTAYPEQWQSERLEGRTTFIANDFLKPEAMAQALVDAGDNEETAAGRVWNRLSAAQQEALAAADTSAKAREALLALNDVLGKSDLYEAKAFSGIPRLNETRELLHQQEGGELNDYEQRRLNRLLIQAAFAERGYVEIDDPNFVRVFTWTPVVEDERIKLTTLNAHEGFMIFIKAALITGLVLASPWVFYQIWIFVAAGLYPHEKKYVYLFLPISLGLFIVGASFAFFLVFQPVLKFLLTFNEMLGIDPDPRISEWLSFVLFLPLGFGISFQLPLVMLFLERIGIFTVETYIEKWRISVLVIAVVSMILTPADPTSMLLMAVPLTFLYFGGIVLVKYLSRNRSPFDAPQDLQV